MNALLARDQRLTAESMRSSQRSAAAMSAAWRARTEAGSEARAFFQNGVTISLHMANHLCSEGRMHPLANGADERAEERRDVPRALATSALFQRVQFLGRGELDHGLFHALEDKAARGNKQTIVLQVLHKKNSSLSVRISS
ncbi:MAG TPA: hypothetical protein VGP97_00925 [Burkholderiales bacterium]|nr:hypothetical protein [Burkholderiales bacterium]